MNLIDHKKLNKRKDIIQPIYIGNFLNNLSSIAKMLMADAAIILKDLVWENEFIIYYYSDKQYVRLYLRVVMCQLFILMGNGKTLKPDCQESSLY